MTDAFVLAWRYLQFHAIRSSLVVVALGLAMALPMTVEVVVDNGEAAMRHRATQTPLVAGGTGQPIESVIASLWYRQIPANHFTLGDAINLESSTIQTIGLLLGHTARKHPVVATDPRYLEFRHLMIATGRPIARMGECLLGAAAARDTGLTAGDTIVTDPENAWDLVGSQPLMMDVVGVLSPAHSPDDDVVFTDLATGWIIQGLGHGHGEVSASDALGVADGVTVAGSSIATYRRITDANVDSWHFHGAPEDRPITTAIILPSSHKAGLLLQVDHEESPGPIEITSPQTIVNELLASVFEVRRLLTGVLLVVAASVAIMLLVVLAMTLRLRAPELATLHALGCDRSRVRSMLAAEVLLLLVSAALFAVILTAIAVVSLPELSALAT
jgi:putative ABC transport system permease protein